MKQVAMNVEVIVEIEDDVDMEALIIRDLNIATMTGVPINKYRVVTFETISVENAEIISFDPKAE